MTSRFSPFFPVESRFFHGKTMVKQPFFVVKTMVKATVSDGEKKARAPHHCLAPRASSWDNIIKYSIEMAGEMEN